MAEWVQYTKERKTDSDKYSSTKSRVKKKHGYNLEDYWMREDFIDWHTSIEKNVVIAIVHNRKLKSFITKHFQNAMVQEEKLLK